MSPSTPLLGTSHAEPSAGSEQTFALQTGGNKYKIRMFNPIVRNSAKEMCL